MAQTSLGLVAPTGGNTFQRATINAAVPSARLGVQSIQFQVRPANTGLIYIGTSDINVTTGVGVLAVLPAPTSATNGAFASASFTEVNAPAGLNAADFYVWSVVSADGVYVSYTVQ